MLVFGASIALPCALRCSDIFGTIALAGTDGPGVLLFALAGTDGPSALPFALAGPGAALPFALAGMLPSPQLPFLHSPDYISTDSEDDCLHGYMMPIIRGHQLRIINIDG